MPESRRNLSRPHSPRRPDPRAGTEAHKARQREAMREMRIERAICAGLGVFGSAESVAAIFRDAQILPARAVYTSHVYREEFYENR
jgi:hypothetical protein